MTIPPATGLEPGDSLEDYRAAVDAALRETRDIWGEEVLRDPDGPSMENVGPWLAPVLFGDNTYLTDTGVHYIVMTEPMDATSFALHVADGSQVLVEYTNRWASPEWGVQSPPPERGSDQVVIHHLHVGDDATELFGTHLPDHTAPTLAQGWLPILQNSYVDGSGTRWQRESFATRDTDSGELISYLTVQPLSQTVEVASLRVSTTQGEETLGALTADFPSGSLTSAAHFRLANAATPDPLRRVDAAEVDAARERCVDYWTSVIDEGARVTVPDATINNAWRNLVLQNSVLGERYSIGNPYETTFLMEAHGAMLSLLRWGFTGRSGACLDRLAGMTNGPGPEWYESWERGIKLSAIAEHARLTGSLDLVDRHLSTYLGYLDDFARQRATDPRGLLAPERYAWDIPTVIYGWHSQATAWKGARDLLAVLVEHQSPEATPERLAEVDHFRASILTAMDGSVIEVGDGSLFIPVALFEDEKPHETLTGTRIANYWNLVAPYALATGIVEPGSDLARGLFEYMASHGAWLLGLTRFNGLDDPPTPIGESREDGTGGYRTPGIDNAFGVQTLPFLAANDEGERIALALYAKLAHGMTRGTFVDGEATTIGVYHDDFHRSTWYPPNGTSNSLFLDALKLVMVREVADAAGVTEGLDLGWANPRWWLRDGNVVEVAEMPTAVGRVSYRISSAISTSGAVEVEINAPAGAQTRLHVRLPDEFEVDHAAADPRWTPELELLDFGAAGSQTSVSLPVRKK